MCVLFINPIQPFSFITRYLFWSIFPNTLPTYTFKNAKQQYSLFKRVQVSAFDLANLLYFFTYKPFQKTIILLMVFYYLGSTQRSFLLARPSPKIDGDFLDLKRGGGWGKGLPKRVCAKGRARNTGPFSGAPPVFRSNNQTNKKNKTLYIYLNKRKPICVFFYALFFFCWGFITTILILSQGGHQRKKKTSPGSIYWYRYSNIEKVFFPLSNREPIK